MRVIGDLAGFAAATYKRGIDFIYLPTTLLAHDSSIGGKVAINLEDAKNIIGQFYPPKRVIFDLGTFQTLPDEEKRSGLAEMVKHGLIKDVQLFDQLLTQMDDEMDLTDDDFKHLLKRSILVKRALIEKDEFEVGERQFLNFGHTLGHAIELLERSRRITHGESVMIGMHFALWLSEVVNGSRLPIESLASFAVKLNYPTDRLHVSADDLINAMKRDKKNVASNINMVLIEELGRPHVHSFKFEELKQHLTRFLDRWNKGDFIESINE